MSILSSTRCVLVLGDEGLQIYNVGRLSVKFVDFIPWQTEDFVTSVKDVIVKKCGRNPIVVLNDMVEQHYRKERIPKVSILDRKNVLNRRLQVAFPNYKVRAALKINDKKVGLNSSEKGGAYLLAAIPGADSFNSVIEAIRRSSAPIIGFYLLPIEAAAMVKVLSAKVSKGQRYKPAWTIFIGQHHNGGLRQIVTRDGQLALTRMTPIVDTDIEPDLWANEVTQEINATMTYLSRFGYQETDGLEIIVIANDSAKEALDNAINIECDLKVFDAQEVAKTLGVNLGQQEDLRYADPIHAAYLGKRKTFQLPMQSMAIDALTKPRRVASYLMLALLGAAAYFGYTATTNWQKSVQVMDQLVVAQQRNKSLKEEYAIELEKKKELGFDFLYVDSAITTFEDLQSKKLKILPIVKRIGVALGTDIQLDEIKIETKLVEDIRSTKQYGYNDSVATGNETAYSETIMTISFPNTVPPDVGVEKINSLQNRLTEKLPDYEVSIEKQIADLSYSGNVVGESGSNVREELPEKYDAQIKIWGRIR